MFRQHALPRRYAFRWLLAATIMIIVPAAVAGVAPAVPAEAAARYVLAVTFDIIGHEIQIYDPLRVAVQELQAEVEVETEAEVDVNVE